MTGCSSVICGASLTIRRRRGVWLAVAAAGTAGETRAESGQSQDTPIKSP